MSNRRQRILAEKIITETLHFGELNKISDDAATQFGNFIQNVRKPSCSQEPSKSSPKTIK